MILELLRDDVVLGDGGAIFELERRGYISAGPFTPEVCLDHPEALKQLQVDYARAGAQVLQALTYYAHEEKLKAIGRANALAEILVAQSKTLYIGEQARSNLARQASIVSVIEPAVVPEGPSRPNMLLNAALGAVVGLG